MTGQSWRFNETFIVITCGSREVLTAGSDEDCRNKPKVWTWGSLGWSPSPAPERLALPFCGGKHFTRPWFHTHISSHMVSLYLWCCCPTTHTFVHFFMPCPNFLMVEFYVKNYKTWWLDCFVSPANPPPHFICINTEVEASMCKMNVSVWLSLSLVSRRELKTAGV